MNSSRWLLVFAGFPGPRKGIGTGKPGNGENQKSAAFYDSVNLDCLFRIEIATALRASQ